MGNYKYVDYMKEISKDKLLKGLLGYGLFADVLPNIFTSEQFYNYCSNRKANFDSQPHQYIHFNHFKWNNKPRPFGIPVPFAYFNQCKCLCDHWGDIIDHFEKYTKNSKFKISRIHVRCIKDADEIFEMNYKNFEIDDSPIDNVLIGKKYKIDSDISTCFPSIYTHALCWAIMGKDEAKLDKKKHWANKLDKFSRNTTDSETHGLLIGPHISNILSEIILTVVDSKLSSKYEFIRTIDDYQCYTNTVEEAEKFIVDLNNELAEFDLPVNWSKTKITELPMSLTDNWTRRIQLLKTSLLSGLVKYNEVHSFLDSIVEIMKGSNNNAVLSYTLKILSKVDLTHNAQRYCLQFFSHLLCIYPYLLKYADKWIFENFKALNTDISKVANIIYSNSIDTAREENLYYSLYFAIKYDFKIDNFDIDSVLKSNNDIYKVMALIYVKKYKMEVEYDLLKVNALRLNADSSNYKDRNWLFIYECLNETDLKDEWKEIKSRGISFIQSQYKY